MSPPLTEILATLLKILFDASPPNQNPGYAPASTGHVFVQCAQLFMSCSSVEKLSLVGNILYRFWLVSFH